ncbi:MAG: reverse transcriptase/maturase family protein, partial [Spirochaetaceae bacterium]|nr:reverse transcriptase/maturase family protein [Spirochaetaceae bacterium]
MESCVPEQSVPQRTPPLSAFPQRRRPLRERLCKLSEGFFFLPAAILPRVRVQSHQDPCPYSRNETRPIGIPTFEDKVLQRAVQMLLEPLYEQDFLDCSHGFRPKRSPHTALEALWNQTMRQRGGWVIDLDIRKFFDTLSHSTLRKIFAQRMRDGVIARLIGKW